MSHLSVLVVGDCVEDQLAPFDENASVDRYVQYSKEQLIAKGRKEIENTKNGLYAEYLADPKAYELDCKNPQHITYIRDEFPKKLNWSDEEIYQDSIRWYSPECIGEDGEVYSTYNPESKWDWYLVGGRWSGFFKIKEGRTGKRGEPSLIMDDFVYPEGRADIIRLCDIDFESMRNEARLRAKLRYIEVERALEGTAPHKPWEFFKEKREKNLISATVARDAYWQQERCARWKEAVGKELLKTSWGDSPDDYLVTIDEYCSNAALAVCVPFAILYKGQWIERGTMGWFGMLHNETMSETNWDKTVAAFYVYLFKEDPQALLTIVDCHI